jgi:rhodanese-related sulfurtransferase
VKFIIENWLLLCVVLVSGGMLLWPLLNRRGGGGLDPAAAVQLINRERAVVVDVSEPDEFAAGHIGGAKNLPLGQFEAKLADTVKNKTVPLILVCATGVRAGRALAAARKLGFEHAQTLGGGLKAWKDANLPLQTSSR